MGHQKRKFHFRPHKTRGAIVAGAGGVLFLAGIATVAFFPPFGIAAIIFGGSAVVLGGTDFGLKQGELHDRKHGRPNKFHRENSYYVDEHNAHPQATMAEPYSQQPPPANMAEPYSQQPPYSQSPNNNGPSYPKQNVA
jgi:hypothetical protein